MPTYEYRCPKCGVFDVEQKITEEALTACPECGEPIRRLISRNVGFIFKGSGFYTTDYRSQEYSQKAKEESGSTPASSDSSSSTSSSTSSAPSKAPSTSSEGGSVAS